MPMGRASDLFRIDRFRSQAKQHAARRANSTFGESVLPLHRSQTDSFTTHAGGLNSERDAGRGTPTDGSAARGARPHGARSGGSGGSGGVTHEGVPEVSAQNDAETVSGPSTRWAPMASRSWLADSSLRLSPRRHLLQLHLRISPKLRALEIPP